MASLSNAVRNPIVRNPALQNRRLQSNVGHNCGHPQHRTRSRFSKNLSEHSQRRPSAYPSGHPSGKITLLALVFLVAIVLLIGFVGNAGHVVTQKLEIQNASDSVAFSTALWQARGMNCITACNHIVGESTALCVLHEAISGPELRLGLRKNTQENQSLSRRIQALKRAAPMGRIPNPYVPPPLTRLDKKLIDFVARQATKSDNASLTEFATLYDSRITLKREISGWLMAKSLANLAFLVPPPVGYVPAIAAIATHVTASVNIALCGKEWLYLKALASYARAATPVQERILAEQLIPALTDFAGEVAGLTYENGESVRQPSSLIASSALETAEQLWTDLKVEGTLPTESEITLPVEYEPAPQSTPTDSSWYENSGQPAWGSDNPSVSQTLTESLAGIESKLNKSVRRLRSDISELGDLRDELIELADETRDEADSVTSSSLAAYRSEIKKLDELIDETQSQIDRFEQRADQIEAEKASLEDGDEENVAGKSQNLSLQHIPSQLPAQSEVDSHWLHATMPPLDQMRAPILGLMQRHLKKSKAAEHYEKWTNRYALIAAWKFRSGQRLKRSSQSTATWSSEEQPMGLLVLVGSYVNNSNQKGLESWRDQSASSQQEAETLFTTLSVTHRKYRPLFSPTVFDAPNQNGITTFALGMLYNANPKSQADLNYQGELGWDTLAWHTGGNGVAKWGSPASVTSAAWPWEIFDSSANSPLVKLNWQAKLMPVTKSSLENSPTTSDLPPDQQSAVALAVEHSELLQH